MMPVSFLQSDSFGTKLSDCKNDTGAAGFTLLEILMALAISALLLAGVASTLTAVTTTSDSVRRSSLDDRVASILMDRLALELGSAIRRADTDAATGREDGVRDEIALWTAAYGSPRRIRYFWREETLWRQESDPVWRDEPAAVPVRAVTRLGFRYHDGQTWREGWTDRALPAGIAVELRVNERVYGTIVRP
jgi:prepilin-type N-terminal cleavage/methylation domain-containing protein